MSKEFEFGRKNKEGRKTMNPKMKLVAGPARVSARLLTAKEIKTYEFNKLKPPLTYGLVTSIGWNFVHTTEGLIIIFNLNAAVKVFSDTYIIEERMILAKFLQVRDRPGVDETTPFAGFPQEINPWEKSYQ